MNTYRLALGAAAVTGILVGAAMVATRVVAPVVSPVTLAFLRYLIGLAFLALPLLRIRWPRYTIKDAAAIAVLGIFQFAVLIILVNYALESLSAGLCALIFSTMPLATMCLALALRQESLSSAKTIGIVLAITGVAVSLSPSSLAAGGGNTGWSSPIAIIAATIVGAACSVLYRPYLKRYPTLPTSGIAMFSSVVFLTLACLLTGQTLWPSNLNIIDWLNIVFMGFASGLGYYLWLWALGRIDASRVVAFQALGPITAALIELPIERHLPSWTLCLSIVLVVSGLLLVQRMQVRAPARIN
ncbi:DMT family transporter [Paralcaligenes ureilyticus]|uniref:EamA-like transporter family protein n=1 Tax=Paralcaligenes ureilyticus TaxID=627131 RepID=A0A4R3LN62_9BURK|nr:DMT family transporter [Paralcaligenes ureilyticus]TCT01116.1 EamA-like transporter family protein [Paralcaligenes ureilyticus]